jgi:ankyrin repeat protein
MPASHAARFASSDQSLQALQLLLVLQPPPDLALADADGYGPLQHACLGGSVDCVQVGLDTPGKLSCRLEGGTFLHTK